MSQRSTLKFFRLRRADYLLKNTSVSCTFWEPDPAERLLAERRPRRRASHALVWKRHAFSSRIAL